MRLDWPRRQLQGRHSGSHCPADALDGITKSVQSPCHDLQSVERENAIMILTAQEGRHLIDLAFSSPPYPSCPGRSFRFGSQSLRVAPFTPYQSTRHEPWIHIDLPDFLVHQRPHRALLHTPGPPPHLPSPQAVPHRHRTFSERWSYWCQRVTSHPAGPASQF